MKIKTMIAGLAVAAFAAVAPATAQNVPAPQPAPANDITIGNPQFCTRAVCLGYITGTNAQVNDQTRAGLESLSATMIQRTSIAPARIVGLNIENDEILFYPFIYFPVTADTAPLSAAAQRKLQSYLDNGGMLLIDTRDNGSILQRPRDLSQVLGPLQLKPLVPITDEHVLTRSFYLVAAMPGTTPDGTLWIEQPGAPGSESVSSVIIGGRNWAGAWSAQTLPQASREREMALRAGVNMLMYALTGNYKADQTHIPAILERLGR